MKTRETSFALISFALILLFFACGKKGELKIPEAIVPQEIKDLKAKASGNEIILHFSIPTKNNDGSLLTDLRGFKVLRSEKKLGEGCVNCPGKFILIADIEYPPKPGVTIFKGEVAEFRDKNLFPSREYQYRIISYNSQGEFSKESNTARVFWDIPPSPVKGFNVTAGDRMINLSWEKVEKLSDGTPLQEPIFYNCYVGEAGKELPFSPHHPQPLETSSYQAVDLKNDQPYLISVHAVRKVGEGWVESESSPIMTAIPVDLIPPSTPEGLTAFWTDKGVSLRWEFSPEIDLAGYNIYRREEGELTFKKLNTEPLKFTVFIDTDAKRNKDYYYAVSAVDNSLRKNESPLSEEVKVTYFP